MEVIAKYPCSEQTLYASVRQLWDAYKQNYNGLFEGFRTYYTTAYANEAMKEVKEAENLPDMAARSAEAENHRVAVLKQAELCLSVWQDLKAYIWDAFPEDLVRKQMLENAGSLHYRRASKEDWAALQALNQSGKAFLASHTAELTAEDNMPAGFVKTYNVATDRFEDYLRKMNNALATATEGRKAKVTANNNLYEKCMRMARDGARRAAATEDVRRLFIFSKVIDRVEANAERQAAEAA
jgi:hypothetical protein